jgi:hypothetical protein
MCCKGLWVIPSFVLFLPLLLLLSFFKDPHSQDTALVGLLVFFVFLRQGLPTLPRLSLNSQPCCFSLLSAGITVINHHAWPEQNNKTIHSLDGPLFPWAGQAILGRPASVPLLYRQETIKGYFHKPAITIFQIQKKNS